jgi:nucleoside kinase
MALMSYVGVFGHVALDYIVSVPKLPDRNTTIQILGRRRYFGGTAGNLARAAGRLGLKSTLASFVGGDFPPDYREALRRDRVDLRDLRVVKGANTPAAWIFSDPRGNQIAVFDQGAMMDAPGRALQQHSVRDVQLVHIGTGRPEYYAKVARFAEELNRPIAFDPSQEIHYVYRPAPFRSLLARATYFFGNEAEVARARRLVRATQTRDLLRYVDVLIVTRGDRGSEVFTRGSRTHVPRVKPRRVVDVTGAGDAYRAGFYAGLARGYDLRHCAILGSSVASFVIEEKGTQTNLPTWSQALHRAESVASF